MTYLYPPYPVIPTIPTSLPNPPFSNAGVSVANSPYVIQSGYDVYLIFQAGSSIQLPPSASVYAKSYYIKQWGATSVVIYPPSGETLDASSAAKVVTIPLHGLILNPWATQGWYIV
jgi:hypothetical protein